MSLPVLDIACLGQFHVTIQGQPARFATDHGRALLSYLAIEADRPHTRIYLAYMLWPDQPEAQALNNLRQTLTRLRQALSKASENGVALSITTRTLQLNSHAIALDVQQFRQLLAECKTHPHSNIEQCGDCIPKLERAVKLYKGEFLQGLSLRHSQPFTEWASYVREELHQQMIFALQTLAQHHESRGAYTEARAVLARLLAMEPWQEEAHLQLIRVFAKSGQRTAAILQYETCRRVLQEELGIAPSTEINALYEQIRNDTFGRERERASLLPDFSPSMRSQGDEFPSAVQLVGREAELAQLKEWLIYQQSQVVTIWGMGGMGKTALTTAIAEEVGGYYAIVLWHSLLNASTPEELLRTWLLALATDDVTELPEGIDAQLAQLMHHLRTQHCLLILDNLESILDTRHAGNIHPDFAGYTQLFQQIAETQHQSSLLLTSREQLQILASLEDSLPWIHTLRLEGLNVDAAQILLSERNLASQMAQTATLVERYSGNPLALKLIAETIQEIFGGKIENFLAAETMFFDDIRFVLEEQFRRLPALEQDILLWFAVERESLSLETLIANLSPKQPTHQLVQAVRALQRRSLLLHANNYVAGRQPTHANTLPTANFMIPNVLMEYLVDHLVHKACREIAEESLHHLHTHALVQAQAKEYVRQSQVRSMMLPIASYLETSFGREGVSKKIRAILSAMRKLPIPPRSYAVGNLLNLLIVMDIELDGLDLATLSVWQADLRHAHLENVNFTGADLSRTRFADSFAILFAIDISPDGKMIAAGSSSGEIRLWNAESGDLLYVYRGHRGPVRSVAFSPDGKMLASGGEDGYVRLWSADESVFSPSDHEPIKSNRQAASNASAGLFLKESLKKDANAESVTAFGRVFRGHTARITKVAFHPNGRMLASTSFDHTVRLWDVTSGETRAVLHEYEQPVLTVSFSPNGELFAISDFSGMIYLWDSQRAELTQVLNGHVATIRSLAFDPKGKWLASTGHDGKVLLWDLSTGEIFKTIEPSKDVLVSAAFSPDGAYFAVAGDDHTIYLLSTETWRILYPLRVHEDSVCDLVFSPDSQTLISAGADHLVCIWDLQALRIRHRLSGYSRRVNTLVFHPSGKFLASGHYDRGIRLWDIQEQRVYQTLLGHSGGVNSLAFSDDSTLMASGNDDGSVHLWKMPQNKEGRPSRLYVLRGHQRDVTNVIFYNTPHPADDEGSQRILSSSEDRRIGVWDVEFGQLTSFLTTEAGPLWFVKTNTAGTLLATVDDHNIHLWGMPEGIFYKELRGHTRFIWDVAFRRDGALLASGGNDGSIALWDVRDPTDVKLHNVLYGHTDRVFVVASSPDGKYLACGSADNTITLWDWQTQELLHRLEGHNHWIGSLAFSPDGKMLASGGWDEMIYLWDTESGKAITSLVTPGPYDGMQISGTTGISDAERAILIQLGAIEM